MRKKRINYYFIAVIIILLVFSIFSLNFQNILERKISPGKITRDIPLVIENPIYHAHVDFKVFLEGNEISFNKLKFNEVSKYAHLHLTNPHGDKVIHIEGTENITIGLFFESLGMKFNSTCFVLDTGEGFCNNFEKRIRFFVNGNENFQFDLYEFRDLDKILITYGDETDREIENQKNSITDYACIFSRKCPERTKELPITESQLIF